MALHRVDPNVASGSALVFGANGIVDVNLTTKALTLISGGNSAMRGSGPPLDNTVRAIAVLDASTVMATNLTSLILVDMMTGDRTIGTGAGTGSGPALTEVTGVGRWNGQAILVHRTSLISVGLSDGTRAVISGPTTGMGPEFSGGHLATDEGNDRAYVLSSSGRLTRVDLGNGNREEISPSQGVGPSAISYKGVAFDAANNVIVASGRKRGAPDCLFTIDLASGQHTIVSGPMLGVGPDLDYVGGVTWDTADGSALVISGESPKVLVRVDIATGNRTVVAP